MTILVLEETEADLGHHQRILETIPGVRLGLFADPAAATKIYVDQKIDVLVVDDGIPEGGLPFLKQVHLLSGRRDVPVILLAANGDKDVRRAAYEYGVYNVIEKPIDPVDATSPSKSESPESWPESFSSCDVSSIVMCETGDVGTFTTTVGTPVIQSSAFSSCGGVAEPPNVLMSSATLLSVADASVVIESEPPKPAALIASQ